MKYEELQPISREEAQEELASGEQDRVCRAIIRLALYDPDPQWTQDRLVDWIEAASDPWSRGVAATGLGHVARLHGQIDRGRVIPLLERLRDDPEIGAKIEDALEDIEKFAK
jgi:hypothetical protein